MQGFEDVTLTWQGQSFIVPANRQMMLIAVIEDALSGSSGQQALTVLFRREGPPYSKLAAAFGAALRHAGARVSDEEVYLSMMEDMAHKSKAAVTEMIQATIVALLSIIAPPAARALTGGEPAPVETSEKKG